MVAEFNPFLTMEFFRNPVSSYIYAAVLFGAAMTGLYLLKLLASAKLRALAVGTETDLDDLALNLLHMISPLEYGLIALYLAIRHLALSAGFDKVFTVTLLVVLTYRAISLLQHLGSYWIDKIVVQRGLTDSAKATVLQSTRIIMRVVIWIAAALFVLANLGVNVSAVLTGLGIGGVAVALAAQAILGDLFNFFVILLDKPFSIGDFITSDDVSGTIEHIGLKSTRIRSISGELVVVSNSNLLSSRIRNYRHLEKRRVVFKTCVAYLTGAEKLRKVPALIKESVLAQAGAEFERSTLYNTGDFALEFETVYNLNNGDYLLYMETQERVLLGIIEGFARAGIAFASPAHTLLVNKL